MYSNIKTTKLFELALEIYKANNNQIIGDSNNEVEKIIKLYFSLKVKLFYKIILVWLIFHLSFDKIAKLFILIFKKIYQLDY